MIKKILWKEIEKIIRLSLEEDLGSGDITSAAIFDNHHISVAEIISKEDGIFCGEDLVKYIYHYLDRKVEVIPFFNDGSKIGKGLKVIQLTGPTKSLLAGERTCLNFIQRMSGIATKTFKLVTDLSNSSLKILDTRKTAPGLRRLDKYAVKIGGGENHRFGLYDLVMLKDNHLKASGGITEAVQKIKKKYKDKFKIEVETTTLKEVKEALKNKVDIIMLDNMNKKTMGKAILEIDEQAKIEISGNINEKKLKDFKDLKVDFISLGSLTHSVKAFDFSMKFI